MIPSAEQVRDIYLSSEIGDISIDSRMGEGDLPKAKVASFYLPVFYDESGEAVVGLKFFFILAEVPLDDENTQRVVSPSVLLYVRPGPGYGGQLRHSLMDLGKFQSL